MTTQQDASDLDEQSDGHDPGPRRGGARLAVYVAAAVALLLVGAAAGMLVARAVDSAAGVPGMDSVDVGFCQDMRFHHLQAVTMATMASGRSTDSGVLTIAFDIEGGQTAQIGMMSGWLNLWERPAFAEQGKHLAWLPGAGQGHGDTHGDTGDASAMPGMGMATTDEIARLRSLSGPEFDVYFLQLMVRHHQGGVPMATYAAEHAGVGVVRNLASKIVSAQKHEVRVMTDMLADRGAEPLPAPN